MRTALALTALTILLSSPAVAAQRDDVASDWTRVVALRPGDAIIITRTAAISAPRYFVSATDNAITVLNLTDPAVPTNAETALLNLARRYPADFDHARRRGTFLMHWNVRLSADGVFVDDRKVADFADVVENIPRHDVTLITEGGAGGSTVGAAVGLAVGALGAWSLGPRLAMGTGSHALTWISIGALPTIGGLGGYLAGGAPRRRVVYRTP